MITDATLQTRFAHAEIACRAAAGGADTIQLREKRPLTTHAFVSLTREVREALAPDVPLLVNDRADVALEAGAEGLHIGQDDLLLETARTILGSERLIGGTANSLEEARAWFGRRVDYLGVGPVFGTTSKDNPAPVLGLDRLAEIIAESPIPVVAIGGVQPEHVAEVMDRGAWGVAVLSGVACAGDPTAAARRYREAIDAVLRERSGTRTVPVRPSVSPELHPDLPERADVVVVGGGVIGLACGFELAERGRAPLVLERDDVTPSISTATSATSATWASGGMLGAALEADVELQGLDALRHAAQDAWPDFASRLEAHLGRSCGYLAQPSLLVALTRDHELELERSAGMICHQGFEARPLDRAALLECEPSLSSRVISGLELPRDHAVDPRVLVASLSEATELLGGEVVLGATVEQITPDGIVRGWHRGQRFQVAADVVVLATGAWSQAPMGLPFRPLPVRPVKGQLVLLRASAPSRVIRTPDVYVIPRADGRVAVGATVEEQGFDSFPTVNGVVELLSEAWRTVPELGEAPLEEIAVGFRPAARDHLPIVGRYGDTAVLVATGHYRNGLLLAPLTARAIADLTLGAPLQETFTGFGPERFATESIPSGGR